MQRARHFSHDPESAPEYLRERAQFYSDDAKQKYWGLAKWLMKQRVNKRLEFLKNFEKKHGEQAVLMIGRYVEHLREQRNRTKRSGGADISTNNRLEGKTQNG